MDDRHSMMIFVLLKVESSSPMLALLPCGIQTRHPKKEDKVDVRYTKDRTRTLSGEVRTEEQQPS